MRVIEQVVDAMEHGRTSLHDDNSTGAVFSAFERELRKNIRFQDTLRDLIHVFEEAFAAIRNGEDKESWSDIVSRNREDVDALLLIGPRFA